MSVMLLKYSAVQPPAPACARGAAVASAMSASSAPASAKPGSHRFVPMRHVPARRDTLSRAPACTASRTSLFLDSSSCALSAPCSPACPRSDSRGGERARGDQRPHPDGHAAALRSDAEGKLLGVGLAPLVIHLAADGVLALLRHLRDDLQAGRQAGQHQLLLARHLCYQPVAQVELADELALRFNLADVPERGDELGHVARQRPVHQLQALKLTAARECAGRHDLEAHFLRAQVQRAELDRDACRALADRPAGGVPLGDDALLLAGVDHFVRGREVIKEVAGRVEDVHVDGGVHLDVARVVQRGVDPQGEAGLHVLARGLDEGPLDLFGTGHSEAHLDLGADADADAGTLGRASARNGDHLDGPAVVAVCHAGRDDGAKDDTLRAGRRHGDVVQHLRAVGFAHQRQPGRRVAGHLELVRPLGGPAVDQADGAEVLPAAQRVGELERGRIDADRLGPAGRRGRRGQRCRRRRLCGWSRVGGLRRLNRRIGRDGRPLTALAAAAAGGRERGCKNERGDRAVTGQDIRHCLHRSHLCGPWSVAGGERLTARPRPSCVRRLRLGRTCCFGYAHLNPTPRPSPALRLTAASIKDPVVVHVQDNVLAVVPGPVAIRVVERDRRREWSNAERAHLKVTAHNLSGGQAAVVVEHDAILPLLVFAVADTARTEQRRLHVQVVAQRAEGPGLVRVVVEHVKARAVEHRLRERRQWPPEADLGRGRDAVTSTGGAVRIDADVGHGARTTR